MARNAHSPATSLGSHLRAQGASAEPSTWPLAPMWTFVTVALLAMACAGIVANGEAGHSQLRLVAVPVETMARVQDVCTAGNAGAAPKQARRPWWKQTLTQRNPT